MIDLNYISDYKIGLHGGGYYKIIDSGATFRQAEITVYGSSTTYLIISGVKIDNSQGLAHAYPIDFTHSGNTLLLDGENIIKAYNVPAIRVSESKTLTINNAENSTGSLIAQGGEESAGIGGGPADNCGKITISGGEILAIGGSGAAGIGGGDGGDGGNITITGGEITARGSTGYYNGIQRGGAGIGGGDCGDGGNITISGGEVMAEGATLASGIGGGKQGNGGNITISGGVVEAIGGGRAAGIGGGDIYLNIGSVGNGGNVAISDGAKVYAEDGGYGSQPIGIGSGGSSSGTLTISDSNTVVFESGAMAGMFNSANLTLNDGITYSTNTSTVNNAREAIGVTGVSPWSTATAVYSVNLFQVTFDVNTTDTVTNSPNPNPQVVKENGLASEPNPVPLRTGYTIGGWYTNSGCTAGNEWDFASDTVTADMTLYAKWDINTYTVEFNGNGSDGGSVADQSFTYGTGQNLNANGYTRTGYTFAGWSTTWYGGVVYTDGQSVNNLTAVNNATVTLYAVWTPNTYTVEFDGNVSDGGSMADQSFTYDTVQNLDANGFTKTGYNFVGWAQSATGTVVYSDGQNVNNLTNVNGDTITLYAIWAANTYTVEFVGNGNDGGSMVDQTFAFDTPQNLSINGFTKLGYSFDGWAQSATGAVVYADGESVNNLTDANGDTITLYAIWTQDYYIITYDNNGGSGVIPSSGGNYGDIITLDDGSGFTRTDFVLDGWRINTTDYLLSALYTFTETVTAEAIWAADSDNDGVSDDDETTAGTNPNNPSGVPQDGVIKVTVLNSDGSPVSGYTVVLNSTPQVTTTDSEGNAVFADVGLYPHTLSLRDGNTQLGTYSLDFIKNSTNSTTITDDGATNSEGSVNTMVAENFLSLNLTIQLNAPVGGQWQLVNARFYEYIATIQATNPQTGDNTPNALLWLVWVWDLLFTH